MILLDQVPLLAESTRAVDALADLLSRPGAHRGLVVDGHLEGLLAIMDLAPEATTASEAAAAAPAQLSAAAEPLLAGEPRLVITVELTEAFRARTCAARAKLRAALGFTRQIGLSSVA